METLDQKSEINVKECTTTTHLNTDQNLSNLMNNDQDEEKQREVRIMTRTARIDASRLLKAKEKQKDNKLGGTYIVSIFI